MVEEDVWFCHGTGEESLWRVGDSFCILWLGEEGGASRSNRTSIFKSMDLVDISRELIRWSKRALQSHWLFISTQIWSNLCWRSVSIDAGGVFCGALDWFCGSTLMVSCGARQGIPPPQLGRLRTRFLGGEVIILLMWAVYSTSSLFLLFKEDNLIPFLFCSPRWTKYHQGHLKRPGFLVQQQWHFWYLPRVFPGGLLSIPCPDPGRWRW
jgi:hypothetical protein